MTTTLVAGGVVKDLIFWLRTYYAWRCTCKRGTCTRHPIRVTRTPPWFTNEDLTRDAWERAKRQARVGTNVGPERVPNEILYVRRKGQP